MMFRSLALVAALSAASTTSAFQPIPTPHLADPARLSPTSSALALAPSSDNASEPKGKNPLGSLALAGTILATSLAGSVALPSPALASVELSTGAIIVQTSTKQGQSVLKAEVDVKDLLGSLIKNRKALKQSVGRIATVVKEELASPVWTELSKEFLSFEEDVAPELTVSPPRDIQQTISDISKAKLNLIVNGEIINLSVDKTSSGGEDEIVIRAKGVKGVGIPTFSEPAVTKVRTRLEDQLDGVRNFWYSSVPLPDAVQQKLPEGFELETGAALLAGGTLGIGGVYGISYAYYLAQQDKAAKEAEEKRLKLAAKKKAAAEAAAKKKAEEESS